MTRGGGPGPGPGPGAQAARSVPRPRQPQGRLPRRLPPGQGCRSPVLSLPSRPEPRSSPAPAALPGGGEPASPRAAGNGPGCRLRPGALLGFALRYRHPLKIRQGLFLNCPVVGAERSLVTSWFRYLVLRPRSRVGCIRPSRWGRCERGAVTRPLHGREPQRGSAPPLRSGSVALVRSASFSPRAFGPGGVQLGKVRKEGRQRGRPAPVIMTENMQQLLRQREGPQEL